MESPGLCPSDHRDGDAQRSDYSLESSGGSELQARNATSGIHPVGCDSRLHHEDEQGTTDGRNTVVVSKQVLGVVPTVVGSTLGCRSGDLGGTSTGRIAGIPPR